MAMLHLMCGLPLSGKTTVARLLEHEHSALRLTPDEWIARILPLEWDRAELDRLRDPTEAIQWEVAVRALSLGLNVILDWGLWGRSERDALRAQARVLGVDVRLHYCEAPLEDLLARAAARAANLRPGEFMIEERDLRSWWARFEAPTPDELAALHSVP